MRYKGIIFDLDGVICSTDNTIIKHGKPWQIVWACPYIFMGCVEYHDHRTSWRSCCYPDKSPPRRCPRKDHLQWL